MYNIIENASSEINMISHSVPKIFCVVPVNEEIILFIKFSIQSMLLIIWQMYMNFIKFKTG